MAKKKAAARKKTEKKWTAELVIADWKKAVKGGLGTRKALGKPVLDFYEPKLKKKIQERLDAGRDYNKEGADTRAVAKTVGRFCAALTSGTEVSKGVFDKVFDACQLHPRCPGGLATGKWCDI